MGGVLFRERLTVPWVWWVLAALFAVSVLLALGLYVGPVWGVGVAVASLLVAAGIFASAAVAITVDAPGDPGGPSRHRAPLHRRRPSPGCRRDPPPLGGARPTLARIWCSGRTCSTAVEITLDDPADPVPYWLISTRRPSRVGRGPRPRCLHYGWPSECRPPPRARLPRPWLGFRCSCCSSTVSSSPPRTPTRVMPARTCAAPRTSSSSRGSGGWWAPGWPSRCRRDTRPSSTRGPGWRRGTASASSTAPGTVDAGYRGEIKVCLVNTDRVAPFRIARGRPDRPAGHPAGQPGQLRAGRRAARLGPRNWRLRVNRRNTGQLRSATGASRS